MRCLSALLFAALLAFFACPAALHAEEAQADGKERFKIGFVYISPVGDSGWSYAHDLARRKLSALPYVSTFLAEGVAVADTEYVLERMSARAYDLVITTSVSYEPAIVAMAERYPDITYLQCAGSKTGPNLSNFYGRMYQARYLSGMVAGSMTESGTVGFVASFPYPEFIRHINAFTLGVRAVKPDAEVKVAWTYSWYDPSAEKKLARKLVSEGADVLAQALDSPALQEAAQGRGVYSIGYNSDMSHYAPDAHLVAAVWDWSVFYLDVAEKVRAGTWTPGSYWPGMETGIVDISAFGPMVPEEVRALVLQRRKDIIDGNFRIFEGPVYDRDGGLRAAPGIALTDRELLEMDWFVQGVAGSLE